MSSYREECPMPFLFNCEFGILVVEECSGRFYVFFFDR
jgi:hypothetical protein